MQTFLPYANFGDSAAVLDSKRLGKQRVECFQILNILLGLKPFSRWKNHPAVLMWKGYENALKLYYNYIVKEWVRRGYKNTMQLYNIDESTVIYPLWLDCTFCISHQSNLLRKNKEHYSKFFDKSIPDNLEYVWPVRKEK